jgi:uncharacterized protein with LGFP repeats
VGDLDEPLEGARHAAAPADADHLFALADAWGPRPQTGDAADEAKAPLVAEPAPDDLKFFEDQDNPDAVATGPIRVPFNDESPSGRHAKIEIDEPHPARPALHLPLDNPHQAPEGYPVKADTRTGQYWLPNSVRYSQALAEIWFVSEEFAQANGFVRGAD